MPAAVAACEGIVESSTVPRESERGKFGMNLTNDLMLKRGNSFQGGILFTWFNTNSHEGHTVCAVWVPMACDRVHQNISKSFECGSFF